ncbi:MAG: glycosyltransferase family 39 protein [Verrucomicrobiales bacterium]
MVIRRFAASLLVGTQLERRFAWVLVGCAVMLLMLVVATGREWREAAPARKRFIEGSFDRNGRTFASEAERRQAVGRGVRVQDWVKTGMWWAGLSNALILAGLGLTARWWANSPRREIPVAVTDPPSSFWRPRGTRWWAALAVVVIIAAACRAPRLTISLYNDEIYNFRRYIAGQWKGSSFQPVNWAQTFWANHMANNGVPFSVLARLCLNVAHLTGVPEGKISEIALRIPAFVAGLLSIVAVAVLARELAGSRAGLAAASLAALHPWHVRYSTEARCYGQVLLFAALMGLCLVRALRVRSWRWWLAYAAVEFLLVWSFAGAVYFAAGLNAVALFMLVLRRDPGWRQLVVANILAGVLYLQLMAPCFPQMRLALDESPVLRGGVSVDSLLQAASSLLFGQPWSDLDPDNAIHVSIERTFSHWPVPAALALLWSLGMLALGIRCAAKSRPGRMLVLGNMAAVVVAVTAAAATGQTLLAWYLIYLLPMILVLSGVALDAAAGNLPASRPARALTVSMVVGATLAFLALIVRADLVYLNHGKENVREAAMVAEGDPRALRASFWSDAPIYRPDIISIADAGQFQKLVAQARREDRPLWVEFGFRELALKSHREVIERLEDPELFELAAVLPGFDEPQYTHRVFRLKK